MRLPLWFAIGRELPDVRQWTLSLDQHGQEWQTSPATPRKLAEVQIGQGSDLERFAEPGERGFVFVGPKGGQLRRSNFHKSVLIKPRLGLVVLGRGGAPYRTDDLKGRGARSARLAWAGGDGMNGTLPSHHRA
jgi:hypothetical protein